MLDSSFIRFPVDRQTIIISRHAKDASKLISMLKKVIDDFKQQRTHTDPKITCEFNIMQSVVSLVNSSPDRDEILRYLMAAYTILYAMEICANEFSTKEFSMIGERFYFLFVGLVEVNEDLETLVENIPNLSVIEQQSMQQPVVIYKKNGRAYYNKADVSISKVTQDLSFFKTKMQELLPDLQNILKGIKAPEMAVLSDMRYEQGINFQHSYCPLIKIIENLLNHCAITDNEEKLNFILNDKLANRNTCFSFLYSKNVKIFRNDLEMHENLQVEEVEKGGNERQYLLSRKNDVDTLDISRYGSNMA